MFRSMAALATVAVLALGAAACGNDEESTSSQTAAKPDPVAQIDALLDQKTEVTLDHGFVEALGTLKLTPAAGGDGKITKGRRCALPDHRRQRHVHKPGTISPFVQGEIDHDGSGLSLTGGGNTVELTDFVVDPGASLLSGEVSVDGEVAAESAPLFFLDGRTLEPLQTQESTAVLEGTTVKLKDEAATLLNDTFDTDALKGGLVIGVAKITVNTA
jgi:hypothetical protein